MTQTITTTSGEQISFHNAIRNIVGGGAYMPPCDMQYYKNQLAEVCSLAEQQEVVVECDEFHFFLAGESYDSLDECKASLVEWSEN